MGGIGSTRWRGHIKAQTVEGSCPLSVRMIWRQGGEIRWEAGLRQVAASYTVRRAGDVVTEVDLRYTIKGQGAIREHHQALEVIERTTAAGIRQRLWRCPWCNRPVRCFYLPASAGTFACRHCHRLVYVSSQQHDKNAHRRLEITRAYIDRQFAQLARQGAILNYRNHQE
jgi:hypothetical protein